MSHDDFATEALPGLPELPPEGEHILWQGKPNAWRLAWDSLSLPWVIGYFVFLTVWRFVAVSDLLPFGQAVGASVPFLILGAIVVALLVLVGWVQAVSTVYTVTNRRVAMRIGAALTVTLNLPYTQVANIDMDLKASGHGTLAFDLKGDTKLGYLMCWPHVRPWHVFRPQPALRCIPDAARIGQLVARAAESRLATPQVSMGTPGAAPVAAE